MQVYPYPWHLPHSGRRPSHYVAFWLSARGRWEGESLNIFTLDFIDLHLWHAFATRFRLYSSPTSGDFASALPMMFRPVVVIKERAWVWVAVLPERSEIPAHNIEELSRCGSSHPCYSIWHYRRRMRMNIPSTDKLTSNDEIIIISLVQSTPMKKKICHSTLYAFALTPSYTTFQSAF